MNFKEPNSQRLFGHELCDVLAGVADGAPPCEQTPDDFKKVARAMHHVLRPPAAADVESLADDYRLVKAESGRTKMCADLFAYGAALIQDTVEKHQVALDIDILKSELAQHMSELESIHGIAKDYVANIKTQKDDEARDAKILRPLADRSDQMRALLDKAAAAKALHTLGTTITDVMGALVHASTVLQEHFMSVASEFIASLPDEPEDGDESGVLDQCAEADKLLAPIVLFLTKLRLVIASCVEKRFGSFTGTSWHERIIYTGATIKATKNFYDLSAGNISEELLVERLHLFLGMYKTYHEDSQHKCKQAFFSHPPFPLVLAVGSSCCSSCALRGSLLPFLGPVLVSAPGFALLVLLCLEVCKKSQYII